MNRKNALIILGNGFDLYENKLKSDYKSFFEHISNELNQDDTSLIQLIKKIRVIEDHYLINSEEVSSDIFIELGASLYHYRNFSFWNYIFLFKKNQGVSTWYDVERIIGETLKLIENNDYLFNIKKKNINLNWQGEGFQNPDYLSVPFEVKCMILKMYHNEKNESVFQLLMSELTFFENKFKDYLNGLLEYPKAYMNASQKHLMKLLGTERILEEYESINILNFNYTRPYEFLMHEDYNDVFKYINVHGDLENQIIFGIDQSKIPADSKIKSFTKTYRKITSESNSKNDRHLILNTSVKVSSIKLFGLSLNKNDYSYFQSIFDIVDIYNNPIVLEFYYSKYTEEYDCKLELIDKIFELIKNYSWNGKEESTFKEDNLLHKLLLEDRLKVICIDEIHE